MTTKRCQFEKTIEMHSIFLSYTAAQI